MVIEGQEKQGFWDAIGGKCDYASDKRLQVILAELFSSTLEALSKVVADNIIKLSCNFSEKIRLDSSCESSARHENTPKYLLFEAFDRIS